MPTGVPEMRNFIERCHSIATQARGTNYLSREINPDDAMISYFLGVTGTCTADWHIARIYLEQALTMSHILGLHKPSGPEYVNIDGSALVNQAADGPNMLDSRGPTNFILQELGRRVFWVIFVAVKRLQQLGMPSEELAMLPAGKSRQYPPLPMEVDDGYLMHDRVLSPPPGTPCELSGFNAMVRMYLGYNKLSIMEMAGCVQDLLPKETEKLYVVEFLRSVKQLAENLPPNISITHVEYPSDQFGDHYAERNRLRFNAQKAELAVTQLMSRLYVVKEYIIDKYLLNNTTNGSAESQNPAEGLKNPSTDQPEQSKGGLKEMEHLVLDEHEEITKDLIGMLGKMTLSILGMPGTTLVSLTSPFA